jgi:hypothetical protein
MRGRGEYRDRTQERYLSQKAAWERYRLNFMRSCTALGAVCAVGVSGAGCVVVGVTRGRIRERRQVRVFWPTEPETEPWVQFWPRSRNS